MRKILAAAAIVAFASPAFAQLDFDAVDVNADGVVTWEELQAAVPDATEEQFQAADLDGSGDLDREEFSALLGGG